MTKTMTLRRSRALKRLVKRTDLLQVRLTGMQKFLKGNISIHQLPGSIYYSTAGTMLSTEEYGFTKSLHGLTDNGPAPDSRRGVLSYLAQEYLSLAAAFYSTLPASRSGSHHDFEAGAFVHALEVVAELQRTEWFKDLSYREKNLYSVLALFHDFGKFIDPIINSDFVEMVEAHFPAGGREVQITFDDWARATMFVVGMRVIERLKRLIQSYVDKDYDWIIILQALSLHAPGFDVECIQTHFTDAMLPSGFKRFMSVLAQADYVSVRLDHMGLEYFFTSPKVSYFCFDYKIGGLGEVIDTIFTDGLIFDISE